MVLAIRAARADQRRVLVALLLTTAALGVAFLGVKGYEYSRDAATHVVPVVDFVMKPGYQPRRRCSGRSTSSPQDFMRCISASAWFWCSFSRCGQLAGPSLPAYNAPLEVVGLYWSFVDTVWFFLFACIYPLGR